MAKHQGRLELTWTDKDKALLSTGDGKYDYTFVDPSDYRVSEVRLLDEVGRFDADQPHDAPEGLPEPTTDNMLITGDAMHVLDALREIPEYADKYLGKIKLCYIDPPFNTGQAFDSYEDNIEHSIWLTMLRDRLRQIKPLLSADGSIWVHLDDVEVHRCRAVMDEVMGAEYFATQVVWQKRTTRENRAAFSDNHDHILVYTKCPLTQWRNVRNRLPRTDNDNNPDGDPRGAWDSVPFTAQGFRPNQMYTITTPTGVEHNPPLGRCWGAVESEYHRLLEDNRIHFPKSGDGQPRVKQFVSDAPGLVPQTIWLSVEVGTNDEAKREMQALFPGVPPFDTPKPERLLYRIIHIGTNPGDIVLDCFAGSGTTAAVAQKMGRRWVTSELSPENVAAYTKPRLLKVINGEDEGGITTSIERVAAPAVELPDGMTPVEAQEFNRLFNKVKKELDGLDADTLKALRDATKTRDDTTVNWHGGGGFAHFKVGDSMFEAVDGRVYLAEWATNGELTNAICAQLGIRHRPDGIFAGGKGRVRYVILDGMVTTSTVEAIVDQLDDREIVEVWATQLDLDAVERLQKMRPGSRLRTIPDSVLDGYRRKAASRSPFKPVQPDESNGAQN